jgi:ABC-type Na+ efflux pump permease subunit
MAKTKIVVIQLKEIIYTVIFAALGILLILLLIFMFRGGKDKESASGKDLYTPGKYTTSISLGDMDFNLEVVVDKDHINAVNIQNTDEAITTMFPLVKPSLEAITAQIYDEVPIEQLEIEEDKQFTEQLLIDGIQAALAQAKVKE